MVSFARKSRKTRTFLLFVATFWALGVIVFFSGFVELLHEEDSPCHQTLISEQQHGEVTWLRMDGRACNPTVVPVGLFSFWPKLPEPFSLFRRWSGPLRIGFLVDFLGVIMPAAWHCSKSLDGVDLSIDFRRPAWECVKYSKQLLEWEQGTVVKGYIPSVEAPEVPIFDLASKNSFFDFGTVFWIPILRPVYGGCWCVL